MPWYKSGTVSVAQNSNAVIGTGTAFLANSRVGDAFRGPDGGWYEVVNIASDTAMSISPNYQGPASPAGVYALAPMQGYVKESADALRALVNQFGGVLAVLGTTPTLAGIRAELNLTDTDGLPEGSNKYHTDTRVRAALLSGLITTDSSAVVATDALLAAIGKLQAQASAASSALGSKAASGANSDITALSGLTTALSVGQGGTGVKTLAALLAALLAAGAYGKANIVGTVSDAGGLPNGAAFESSVINGTRYVKLADGTLFQYKTVTIGGGTVANGNVFKSLSYDMGGLAISPVGEWVVASYGISQASGGGWAGQQTFGAAGTWGTWSAYTSSATSGSITISLVGIGRWKL